MGEMGLILLSNLEISDIPSNEGLSVDILICLSSYSDASDPWTSLEAQKQALDLLNKLDHLPTYYTNVLRDRIKPLFAMSKNPAVTPQGRRAIDPLPSNYTALIDADAEIKPWKYRRIYLITVFQWILGQLNVSLYQCIVRLCLLSFAGRLHRGKLAPAHSFIASTNR